MGKLRRKILKLYTYDVSPPPSQVNDGEPYVMWLSGLHIPESYLTALVQATCRRNQWPLDKSTLYTSVTEVRLNLYVIIIVIIFSLY